MTADHKTIETVNPADEKSNKRKRTVQNRVGQGLTALNLNLTIVRDQLSDQVLERVGKRLDDSIGLLEEPIPAVRDLMSTLRPALLDEYGLVTALGTHLKEFSSRYGIDVSFEEPDVLLPRLDSSIQITLLRIAQEALFNVAKHAHATKVSLRLIWQESAICLTVQDNGVGMEHLRPETRSDTHGLTVMRERADAVGGTLIVESQPGWGTKIEIKIPVAPNERNAKVNGAGE